MSRWAILVIWNDGEKEYLHEGVGTSPAKFSSRSEACRQKEFMEIGMDGECQSINVVPYPKATK